MLAGILRGSGSFSAQKIGRLAHVQILGLSYISYSGAMLGAGVLYPTGKGAHASLVSRGPLGDLGLFCCYHLLRAGAFSRCSHATGSPALRFEHRSLSSVRLRYFSASLSALYWRTRRQESTSHGMCLSLSFGRRVTYLAGVRRGPDPLLRGGA